MGQYQEGLKSGGQLIVTERDWYIEYYFPGPDLRYNGTFLIYLQKTSINILMLGRRILPHT